MRVNGIVEKQIMQRIREVIVRMGKYGKLVFDIAICIALIPIVFSLGLLISIGILINSPGPVFYLGTRTGLHGVPFRIFKFRTMVVDAEQKGGGTTALNDPRIFTFGRFLRRFKLDELPQILNVLRGEMSIVGPRPELPFYTNQYSEEEMEILSVRPGITDLSSIHFSSLDEIVGAKDADHVFETMVLPEKNKLRLQYVRTRSLIGDALIILLTVKCILRKMVR